jgi:hypothetical protein
MFKFNIKPKHPIKVGDKFRIMSGPMTGVYTITGELITHSGVEYWKIGTNKLQISKENLSGFLTEGKCIIEPNE